MEENKKKARASRPDRVPQPRPEAEDDDPEVPEYRRRARPVRVRRRRWELLGGLLVRVPLRLVLRLAAVLVVLLAARHLVLGSSVFRLSSSGQIEVSGGQTVSRSEVLSFFGADLGRDIFYIPLARRRQQIESIPWVQTALVQRVWPNRLEVRLLERTPVAFVREGREIGLVDANGVLLTPPSGRRYDFPVVSGLTGTDPASNQAAMVGERARQLAVYLKMRQELDGGGAHRLAAFSEINLGDPNDVRTTLVLRGDQTAIEIEFGDQHFLERYNLLAEHLKDWRASFAHLTAIDLRYDGQAILHTGERGTGTTEVGGGARLPQPGAPRP